MTLRCRQCLTSVSASPTKHQSAQPRVAREAGSQGRRRTQAGRTRVPSLNVCATGGDFFSFLILFWFIDVFSFGRVISSVNKRSFVVRLCLGVLDKDRDLSGCGYASVRSVTQKIKLPKDFLFYVPMGLLRFHLFATNVLAARGWLVLMLFTCVSCWIIADCVLFIF